MDYVAISQNLYTKINQFYHNKINEHENIKNIMNEYESFFNEMINKISTEHTKVDHIYFDNEFKSCLNNLEKNINDIKEKYFKNIYLNSHEDFLEHPNEIIFKLEQYKIELENNIGKIKNKINKIYKNRMNNIFKETKTYIKDIHEFNYKYVLMNLNNFNPNLDYFIIKNKVINEYFTSYSNKLNEKLNEIIIIGDKEQSLFNENDINIEVTKTVDKYSKFVSSFEEIILKNFTIEKCKEIHTLNSYSDLFSDLNNGNLLVNSDINSDLTDLNNCLEEIKKSELNFSEYNFNTVKIRSEIYFTKTLIEKIDSTLDEMNYDNIINKDKINEFDLILNDKNILNIYNETKYKLKEIQDANLYMLDEPFELFMNSIKDHYNLENEILPFFNKFEEIISNKNTNYSN